MIIKYKEAHIYINRNVDGKTKSIKIYRMYIYMIQK